MSTLSNKLLILALSLSILIPTFLTFNNIFLIPLTLAIWSANILGFYLFINVLRSYNRLRRYRPRLRIFRRLYRVAAVVTVCNEDPDLVGETLEAVKEAVEYYGYGDVYLLDDSTDEFVSEELRSICRDLGVKYVKRNDRNGFKAGNLNNFLRNYGYQYDILAVFDADQRPTREFLSILTPYFDEDDVAYVFTAQAYTLIDSGVAYGANAQQKPFLYLILPGYDDRSKFSIGSGVLYRVNALLEVGGFDEYNLCEDVATSVKLHELGYKSVYVPSSTVYYGIPPRDVKSYMRQQARWSFGYFQLIPSLIKSRLPLSSFMDYLSALIYWIKIGPVKFFEILAPIFFLLTDIPFLKLDPYLYVSTYFTYFFISLLIFISLAKMTSKYSLKDFLYHQGLENIVFWSVTKSFFKWVFNRWDSFTVTSKVNGNSNVKYLIPNLIVVNILLFAIQVGLYKMFVIQNPTLYFAYAINIFWAAFQLFFQSVGVIVSNVKIGSPPSIKVPLAEIGGQHPL